MRVVCLGIIFNSLAVVQRALLTVKIDFKTQAKASLSAAVMSGVIGITLAYHGAGVWALVVQQLVNLGVNTGLLWVLSSWRPKRVFSWQSFHELFAFGSKLLVSGLIYTIYQNLYTLVIGKLFAPSKLGHYTRAQQFSSFPSSNLTGVIQRVTYPVLCEIRNDEEHLKSVYRRFLKISAFIVFPLMVGLSAVSAPLVHVILGSKWDYCAQLLQILCFAMMWYPIHAINLNLLEVKGRSDLFLRLEIIKEILGVVILCATAPFGLLVMCYGQILNSILSLLINTCYTGKLIGLGFIKQMRDLLPTLILCLAMYILIAVINHFVTGNVARLLVDVIAGATFYLGISRILHFSELKSVFSLIKRK
jgi:O-antigen/teichoic acid export membrane protein